MTTQTQTSGGASRQIDCAVYSTPAIVLAGGRAKPELEKVIGVTVRAMAVVNGRTLLSCVIGALKPAIAQGQITVVGDVPPSPDYHQAPDGGDFVTNLFAGLERYSTAPYVLVSTCDLPYLSADSVDSLLIESIKLAESSGANVIYPIVPVAACYAQFPGIKRTARKLKEGEFTGGNIMLMRPQFMLEHKVRIAAAYAARKSPARLAAMLGIGTLVRLVVSQTISRRLLTIPMLEAKASVLLGGSVRALICQHADIATDLDKPEDFLAASRDPRTGELGIG